MLLINNYTEETILTIKLHSIIAFISLLTNIFGILFLFYYFKTHHIPFIKFKIFSFCPLLMWGFTSLIYVMLGNHIIPIDNYCHILYKVLVFCIQSSNLSLWLFMISRIKYLFRSTPLQLSLFSYWIQTLICIFLTVFGCVFVQIIAKPTVYIPMKQINADENAKYKLCYFDMKTDDHDDGYSGYGVTGMGVQGFCSTLNDIFLLYSLYSKTKQFIAYQKADIMRLSPHFSARNNNLINAKIMRRTLICAITYQLGKWIIFALWVKYRVKYLFAVLGIMSCVVVCCSFDVACNICKNNVDSTENMKKELMQKHANREKYIKNIMAAYYQTPKRQKYIKKYSEIELHMERDQI